jgi:trans-aconitate 2-methyltransferase
VSSAEPVPPYRAWDAVAYDRLADPMARWGEAVVERLILRGDETVLDCGCGTGRVTEKLVERLPRGKVIALDVSADMLAEARRRLATAGERVTFVEADLLELSLTSLGVGAAVDAVLSTATFHWITDHARLFRNLAGVLRPGGQLVAQCGGDGNIADLLAVAARCGVERPGTWEYAAPDVTAERLAAAGFVDVEVWTNEEPTRFDDPERLMEYLEAVCLREAVARMGADERREVLGAIVAAMAEPVIDYVRLNIAATAGAARGRRPDVSRLSP